MTVETLTNAQSLRVIGQQLASLGIDSFEVEKIGDEFVVQTHGSEAINKSLSAAFLKIPSGEAGKSPDPITRGPNSIHLSPNQILQADSEYTLRRHQPTAMPDPYKLSTLLRVLGDYLDRRGADEFAIAYDSASLTVRYGEKSESLRVDILYDLGVHMYLRRSNRGRTQ